MSLLNPYTNMTGGQWLRGNLHTHSTRSDGARHPQKVIDDYAARGYDFLMLSDHDVYCSAEDYAQWDARGMVLISGNEISANGVHLLHVDADQLVPPVKQRQQTINQINTGKGFAIVNHPHRGHSFEHCSIQQLREWVDYLGLEIYNGGGDAADGNAYAVDKWDMLLGDGRRIWGFANDDCHWGTTDIQLGWNVAYVHERSTAAVVEALRAGRFYASTGVTIDSIQVVDDRVRIETANATRIVAVMNTNKRFAAVDSQSGEFIVPGYAKYVRFECWGPGGQVAWTQPIFRDEPARKLATAARSDKVFLVRWQVSDLVKGLALADAGHESPDEPRRPWREVVSQAAGVNNGFIDAREQMQKQDGVVYLSTTVSSRRDQRGAIFLGYDGPVRVWLNGQQIFEGPGANPAVADRTALFGQFVTGSNQLTVALDSNAGRAWGIYARVEILE